MLCWISILGGLLIMMGHQARSEALFYYFRLEDQIPETHLLRLIDNHVSFEFVRRELKDSYSETGRPSIDPELRLRILLFGYLYGITSERKLVEELRMHLAFVCLKMSQLPSRSDQYTTARLSGVHRSGHSQCSSNVRRRVLFRCVPFASNSPTYTWAFSGFCTWLFLKSDIPVVRVQYESCGCLYLVDPRNWF
jgi:hypothetical protein